MTDPYELSGQTLCDSRITTQEPSRLPSRTNSFLTEERPMTRSLNVRERGSPRRRPIFNKKREEKRIELKDAPLYYSIIVEEARGGNAYR